MDNSSTETSMENPIDTSVAQSSPMHIQTEETLEQESHETEAIASPGNSAPLTLPNSSEFCKELKTSVEECINRNNSTNVSIEETELDEPSTVGDCCKAQEEEILMPVCCEIDEGNKQGLITTTQEKEEGTEHLDSTTAGKDVVQDMDLEPSVDAPEVTEGCGIRASEEIETLGAAQEDVLERISEFSEVAPVQSVLETTAREATDDCELRSPQEIEMTGAPEAGAPERVLEFSEVDPEKGDLDTVSECVVERVSESVPERVFEQSDVAPEKEKVVLGTALESVLEKRSEGVLESPSEFFNPSPQKGDPEVSLDVLETVSEFSEVPPEKDAPEMASEDVMGRVSEFSGASPPKVTVDIISEFYKAVPQKQLFETVSELSEATSEHTSVINSSHIEDASVSKEDDVLESFPVAKGSECQEHQENADDKPNRFDTGIKDHEAGLIEAFQFDTELKDVDAPTSEQIQFDAGSKHHETGITEAVQFDTELKDVDAPTYEQIQLDAESKDPDAGICEDIQSDIELKDLDAPKYEHIQFDTDSKHPDAGTSEQIQCDTELKDPDTLNSEQIQCDTEITDPDAGTCEQIWCDTELSDPDAQTSEQIQFNTESTDDNTAATCPVLGYSSFRSDDALEKSELETKKEILSEANICSSLADDDVPKKFDLGKKIKATMVVQSHESIKALEIAEAHDNGTRAAHSIENKCETTDANQPHDSFKASEVAEAHSGATHNIENDFIKADEVAEAHGDGTRATHNIENDSIENDSIKADEVAEAHGDGTRATHNIEEENVDVKNDNSVSRSSLKAEADATGMCDNHEPEKEDNKISGICDEVDTSLVSLGIEDKNKLEKEAMSSEQVNLDNNLVEHLLEDRNDIELSELNDNMGTDEGCVDLLEKSELERDIDFVEEDSLDDSFTRDISPVSKDEVPELNENFETGPEEDEDEDVRDIEADEDVRGIEEDEDVRDIEEVEDVRDIEVSEVNENVGTDPQEDLDEGIEEDEDVRDIEVSEVNENVGTDPQEDLDEGIVSEEQTPRKRGRKPGKKARNKESSPKQGLEHDKKQAHDSGTPDSQSRKRGRKAGTKVTRKEEEDVCFVCYDGGKLILCDKRSCPKAYHIECTGRASEFFERRGQWFCGWHVCSRCSRSATLHCYTCPHALCNTCLKGTGFHGITKSRGLCEDCYAIVQMIEHNETINADGVKVDFNDKETLEGLFNDYWQETKLKYSLTLADLDKVSKVKENDDMLADGGVNENTEAVGDGGSSDSDDKPPTTRQLRLMKRKRLAKSPDIEDISGSEFEEDEDDDHELENNRKRGRLRAPEFDGWASKELIYLIQHMKEDPKKQLPLFEVKKLLWQYIDDNKLTNPRRRGQIMCDERLLKIFGKKHVGRFEMMKLISLHVNSTIRNATSKAWEFHSGENDALEVNVNDDNWTGKKKPRRKADDKRIRPDPWEYAAINVKNINLIYLKRSVLDELRNDSELENKVVGAFVRIRVPSMTNRNDTCYRLVQVVGVKQIYDALDPEKVTDVILEILNLNKREEVTADLVSNQDFVEEECRRLRQSVRCGLIKAMTVGDLEERAKALREAKVKDWFEAELLRLSHLRDRASEKGRKKELRECVEKLQLLSRPEEKERQLNAPFDIDADPHMDPSFESDEEDLAEDDNQDDQTMWEKVPSTRFLDRSPGVSGAEKSRSVWDNTTSAEPTAKLPPTQMRTSAWTQRSSSFKDNVKQTIETPAQGRNSAYAANEKSIYSGQQANWGDDATGRDQRSGLNILGNSGRKEVRWACNVTGRCEEKSGWRRDDNLNMPSIESAKNQESRGEQTMGKQSFSSVHTPALTPEGHASAGINVISVPVDSEKEKIWYYKDPTKTIQGPFTMEQLRKWEKTNLFPLDLRIWKGTESPDASILLTDALAGRFSKRAASIGSIHGAAPVGSTQVPPISRVAPQGLQVNNFSSVTTLGLPNTFSVSPTPGPSVSGYPLAPAQGNTANSFSVGQVHSFPASTSQGSTVHGLPSGPVQVSTAVHGYPPGATQGPQYQAFPPVPTQGTNVQGFAPGPPQVPHVNGLPSIATQGPYMNGLPGGSMMHGSIHGPPNGNNFQNMSMQGASVTGFPQNHTHVPNTMVGVQQGSNFNSAPNRPQAPHMVSHNSNVNIPQHGRGVNNVMRDFRDGPPSVRPGQVFQQPANIDGIHRTQNFGSWGAQGRGEGSRDGRDASNQRHFGHGPKFRGSDYQGNDSRYTQKKDKICNYFPHGLCRKGPACDFRHE